MVFRIAALLALICAPLPITAQDWTRDEAARSFVEANVLATFYHELGHGLIDILDLPVLGREEDAADSLSAVLIHAIWQEEAAEEMVYHTAGAFQAYALEAEAEGAEPAYWGQHSLDMQRYYTLICLFYGANPDERAEIATELELPEDRAAACPEEFQLADESWGAMLEDLVPGPEAKGLAMAPGKAEDRLYALLAEEVADLNKSYGLPEEIIVVVEPCGEANAFYDPEIRQITMCSEYPEDLARIWKAAQR